MNRHHCAGYTLLETLVVIAVISATVIAIPAMLIWFRQQGLSHAMAQIQADLQLARVTAIRQKQNCILRFNVDQYTNTNNGHRTDLRAYRGNVHFLMRGPDGAEMARELTFNSQGMSCTVVPTDIFISDGQGLTTYRIRVLQPGGITVNRWSKDQWRQ